MCPGPIRTCVFAPGRLSGPGLRCHGGSKFPVSKPSRGSLLGDLIVSAQGSPTRWVVKGCAADFRALSESVQDPGYHVCRDVAEAGS